MKPETPAETARTEEFEWLSLDEDEEVLWSGKPHLYSIVPALVVGIPLSVVLVGIPIVVGAYLSRENTVYLLTTEGLYRKQGVLSRDVQKIEFEKIQNISFSQGALGTYVGYGNVDISTAGGAGIEMQFRAVADPKSVQERINRRIRRSRSTDRGEGAGDARRPDDVLDDILTELRAIRRALENGGADGWEFDTDAVAAAADDTAAVDADETDDTEPPAGTAETAEMAGETETAETTERAEETETAETTERAEETETAETTETAEATETAETTETTETDGRPSE